MDNQKLRDFIESRLEGTDYYLVDLSITPTNEIRVEIDSDGPADLEKCIELNRAIEESFPREEEDYELEVGTSGLTSPLKVARQYKKYVGKELDLLTTDGRKFRGELQSVIPGEGITVIVAEKVRHEGSKRPVLEKREIALPFTEIKKATYHLIF